MTENSGVAAKTGLYQKNINCPVCHEDFKTTKVKTSAVRTVSREADFYTVYSGDNPAWYEAFVCPHCGYSAFEAGFLEISPLQVEQVRKLVMPRWKKRDFGGKRTVEEALEAHMLALVCYQVIGAKKTTLGKVCLRVAWLYREMNDPKETNYMELALRNLEEAFSTEHLDEDKANEINVMFLMGELNRRLQNYTEASRWFTALLGEPELKKNRIMLAKVREQMSTTRESFNKSKAGE